MPGFDIESLLEFDPPRYWCGKCYALFSSLEFHLKFYDNERSGKKTIMCPNCRITYTPTNQYPLVKISDFLSSKFSRPLHGFRDAEIINHAKRLADISYSSRRRDSSDRAAVAFGATPEVYPALRGLFESFISARSFIHFTSYGITQLILGALKVVAQRVHVRGIVSGRTGENIISEVTDFQNESPNLSIKFCDTGEFRTEEVPHQKLVVIDGLLAFKGSANLTQTAWRSAEKDMDVIEVVSDVSEVIRLHNRFFSPVWSKMNDDIKGEIAMRLY